MSGLGYKVWSPGDVLAAADVNGYLMDQAVMVFSSSAARTAGIGTATAGMVTFRTDGTALEVYNGSSWVSANSVGGTVAGSQVTGSLTSATIAQTSVTPTLTSSTATAYTIAAADQSTTLRFTNAGTVTVSTATAFTAGQRVDIVADGTASVIAAGSGVTFGGAGTAGTAYSFDQYDAISVLCVGSNTYRIIGNITAV